MFDFLAFHRYLLARLRKLSIELPGVISISASISLSVTFNHFFSVNLINALEVN